jgi:D-alanyl-D-alanine carboxypeptidase (penicillin-binding protein 5/6)
MTLGGPRRGRGRPASTPVNVVMATALLALVVGSVAEGLSAHLRTPARADVSRAAVARARSATTAAGSFATTWLVGHPQPNLDVHGRADVLVDVDRKQVLWQREAHTPRAPASLAKLVTAMVAADLAPLDRSVSVTARTDVAAVRQVEPASTVMGLDAGETLTVRELLYGLFLRSGNDAAETLGSGLEPRDRFIQRMNQKAAALGMRDSHFTTPVGLDDPAMKTSPYDLALAAAAITSAYPDLLAISGTPSIQVPQTATHKAFGLVNYNKLVIPGNPYTYQGATGMKTAFTDDAGPCMVATASRKGRRLVAVVMNSDNFFADATKLLDYGFGSADGSSRAGGR